MKYSETGYRKYMTVEEFESIEKYVYQTNSPSMRMCVMIMMYMGLRVSEAVRLCRDNFTQDWSIMFYQPLKKKKPKTHDRVVPTFLRAELKEYYSKNHYRMIRQFLFFPWKNQSQAPHIAREAVEYFFTKMRRDLKLLDVYHVRPDGNPLYRISPHTLRHHVAFRYLVATKNNSHAVAELLCWADTRMVDRYANYLKSSGKESEIIEEAFKDPKRV